MKSMPGSKNRVNRRPRGSLSRELILDAAERLARSGVDQVTIRAVAAEAQAAPMALYNHFHSKEELVDALLDRVFGRLRLPRHSGNWLLDIQRFARAHRRFLETVPWALPGFFRNPFPGPNTARATEFVLSVLAEAGFSTRDAVGVLSGIVALNYGATMFMIGKASGGGEAARVAMAGLSRADSPSTVAAVGELADARRWRNEMMLNWLLAGVEGWHQPPKTEDPRQTPPALIPQSRGLLGKSRT